jgi:Cu/Ag efflux protein CusF
VTAERGRDCTIEFCAAIDGAAGFELKIGFSRCFHCKEPVPRLAGSSARANDPAALGMTTHRFQRRKMKAFATGGLLLFILLAMVSCNRTSSNSTATPSASATKRYHLKGKIVSIDEPGKMAIVDAEAIPDFMGAMAMPYKIRPESELQKLKPGDAIAADVVVQGENYWLERISITGHENLRR